MFELKPCPFCGANAEMYTGRTYPAQGKALCESICDAKSLIEEYRQKYTVVDCAVYRKTHKTTTMKKPKEKWGFWVVLQGYIPRCTNHKCLGRNAIMFHSEAEAADAWNGRCSDG